MSLSYVNIRSAYAAAFTTILLLCSSTLLQAEEDKLFYTLTAIEDVSFGEQVLSGNYDAAINGILSSDKRQRNGFEAQTNLCVAYIRSGDFDNARDSCDAALVALGKEQLSAAAPGLAPFQSRRIKQRYLALALSNRGVLRAITGKPDLARKDFADAANLRYGGVDAVEVNLAKLGEGDAPSAAPDSQLQDT